MTARTKYLEPIASEEVLDLIQTADSIPTRNFAIANVAPEQRLHANVLGVQVEALDMAAALGRIETALITRQKGYICMAGVHGIMEAQRNPAVKDAFADAFLTLPDGTPTAWVGRMQGLRWMSRLTGPDLMLEVFSRKQFAQYSHFLYGGKPGVAQELSANLSRRFPWVQIAGTYTPPFHDLTAAQERELALMISRAKPDIVWVGISTPRQEMFMRRYLPYLDTSLMFGVGAAFDFHTGRIRDCAEWIKRAGLQWLHRLVQDPRHLLWRYARNNPAFIWHIALQLAGLKTYETSGQSHSLRKDFQCLREPNPDLCTGDYDG
jgi:N-acetylglucosaminyldiphosphoundecaprenol N-acetyl-beta-D-mannosaminyltransferase